MKKLLAGLLGTFLLAAPAWAQKPPNYTLDAYYDISLLGLSIGSAHLELKLTEGRYEMRFFGKPEGMASLFTSNTANAFGLGRAEPGKVSSMYSWVQQVSPKRTQIVEMKYEQGQLVSMTANPVYPPSDNAPTEAQKKGAFDPMGGLVAILMPPGAGDQACGTQVPVYDGKRAYSFDMWTGGPRKVEDGTGGYRGEVLYCVGSYRRIAGWEPKRMIKDSGVKVQVWLAPIGRTETGGPAFYLPVRMWSDVDVGSIVAIPTQVTINGKPWRDFFAEGG